MKKNSIKKTICVILALSLSVISLTACGNSDENKEKDTQETTTEEVMFEEEFDDYDDESEAPDVAFAKKSDYYGTWAGESQKAEDYFGGYYITFNEDGTFDANITSEDFSDTWKYNESDGSVQLEGYLDHKFYFNENNNLLLDDDGLIIVMTKQ